MVAERPRRPLLGIGALADAEQCYREALGIYESLVLSKPSGASRFKMARTCEYMELAIKDQDRMDEADSVCEEVARLRGAV